MLRLALFTVVFAFLAWFILVSWQCANWGWAPTVEMGSNSAFIEQPKPIVIPQSVDNQTPSIPFPSGGDGVVTINATIHGTTSTGVVGSTTLLIAGNRVGGLYTLSQISKSVLGADLSASLSIQPGPTSSPTIELTNTSNLPVSWALFYTFTFSSV